MEPQKNFLLPPLIFPFCFNNPATYTLIIWGRILGIKNAEVCIDIDRNPGSVDRSRVLCANCAVFSNYNVATPLLMRNRTGKLQNQHMQILRYFPHYQRPDFQAGEKPKGY